MLSERLFGIHFSVALEVEIAFSFFIRVVDAEGAGTFYKTSSIHFFNDHPNKLTLLGLLWVIVL